MRLRVRVRRWVWLGTLLLAVSVGTLATSAGALTLALVARATGGHGQQGLYLGDRAWSFPDAAHTNWSFHDDVGLTFRDDGSATIRGTLTRLLDAQQGFDVTWGLRIELRDPVLVGDVFAGRPWYDGALDDLIASGEAGAGIDWRSLSLTLEAPKPLPYVPYLQTTGWVGLAMPELGHDHPAELRLGADGNLHYDAWYTHSDRYQLYRVGDTKADVVLVPEPRGVVLLALGALAVRRFVAGRPR